MTEQPTYATLDELLAAYVGTQGTEASLLAELTPLALEVRVQSIRALLQARATDILDPTNEDRFKVFLEALDGASADVEALVGNDPQPASRRRLALRAIAYATAADLEESLFPEQNIGDGARAAYLRRRYDAVMATLRGPSDAATGVTTTARSSADFPDAVGYPDPARPDSGPWGSVWSPGGPGCW